MFIMIREGRKHVRKPQKSTTNENLEKRTPEKTKNIAVGLILVPLSVAKSTEIQ